MDITTIGGIIAGTFLLLAGMSGGSGGLKAFYDFDSILITIGGTVAGVIVSFPLEQLKDIPKTIKIAFNKNKNEPETIIKTLVAFAEKARREGLLALEEDVQRLDEPFLKKGIQLIVDGTDPELVRNILETELTFLEERHKSGQAVFETAGSLAPAFGMIGTLIGLIQMLQSLSDPSSLGPGMAVALVTTFYGSVLANLFFIPIASKLKVRSSEEILMKEVMVEGMLSIQAGENPRIVEEKLKSFLAPNIRRVLEIKRNEGE
ncbi:MAG TPA: flagellar motor protein [Clostridia bacterium]|nr:flagellar motor protein [Clostridia bacterium]